MPQRVHVLSYGDENTASTHFRFVQYRELLARRDVELVVHARSELGPELLRRIRGQIVVDQKILPSALMQSRLRRSAARLLFDFDDAIWTRPGRPFSLPTRLKVRARLRRIWRAADAVTTSSDYLASHARPYARRCERIPMAVDCAAWTPRTDSPNGRIVVGWAGSPVNLGFLRPVVPALQRLVTERDDVEVRVYCGRRPELPFPFVHVPFEPGTEAAFVRELHVGLCPLPDDEFARGKSPIKILQYLACGVPVAANPVGASRELLDPAWSRTVDEPEGWHAALAGLAGDPELRRELALAGRRFVLERHDLPVVADRLREVLLGEPAGPGVARELDAPPRGDGA